MWETAAEEGEQAGKERWRLYEIRCTVMLLVSGLGVAAPGAELAAFNRPFGRKYRSSRNRRFCRARCGNHCDEVLQRHVVSVGEAKGVFIGRDADPTSVSGSRQEQQGQSRVIQTFVKGDAGGMGRLSRVSHGRQRPEPFTFAIVFLWTRVNGEWLCKATPL